MYVSMTASSLLLFAADLIFSAEDRAQIMEIMRSGTINAATGPLRDNIESGWIFQGSFLLTQLAMFVFTLSIIRYTAGREWRRKLALPLADSFAPPWQTRLTHLVLALIILPGLIVFTGGVYQAAHQLASQWNMTSNYQEHIGELVSRWPWWFGIAVVGLAPGLNEELWCRGFLGRGLLGRYGPVVGIFLSSAFFGLIHMDPPHVVAMFCFGIVLHTLYLWSRSLWVPIVLHVLNNSIAVSVMIVPQFHESLGSVDESVSVSTYMGSVALCASVVWAFYQTRARPVVNINGGEPDWPPVFPGVELPSRGHYLVRDWPDRDWPAIKWNMMMAWQRLRWPTILIVVSGIILFALSIYTESLVSS
jgi:membrane protease YdiL (CAAX protease family)